MLGNAPHSHTQVAIRAAALSRLAYVEAYLSADQIDAIALGLAKEIGLDLPDTQPVQQPEVRGDRLVIRFPRLQ